MAHQRGHFEIFYPFCRKIIEKLKRALYVKKIVKMSHNAEKTERGTLWDFSTSVLSENSKKIEGGTLWENFFFEKKSHRAENTLRGYLALWPLSFLDDVKILLRKLLRQYFKFAK